MARHLRATLVLLACGAAVLAGALPAAAAYPFPTPTGVHVAWSSDTTMGVEWDDVPGADGYRVQYSQNATMAGAKYVNVQRGAAALRRLTPDTRYYVRVAVFDSDGGGKLSDFTAKPAPSDETTDEEFPGGYDYPVPEGLRVTSVGATSIDVDWDDVAAAPEYRVQISRKASMGGAASAWFSTSSGRIDGLDPDTRYFVRVAVVKAGHGAKLSEYTEAPHVAVRTATDTGPVDLRVGSFNVFGVNNDPAEGDPDANPRSWINRRGAVIDDIMSENLDVVGLQEANQSSIYNSQGGFDYLPAGANQYLDLVAGLNAAGGTWDVTVAAYYNCPSPTSSSNCSVPVDRGASNATRIVYRSDRLERLAAGSVKYATQYGTETERYLAWARFRVIGTDKTFTFFTTHLSPRSDATRLAQWQQLISEVNARSGDDPVVVTGDFNTSKFNANAQTQLPAMKSAGYGDVLNQQYQVNPPSGIRAQTVVRGYVNSFNDFVRDIDGGGKCYCTAPNKIGNNIDWIFATNSLLVKRWATVADLSPGFDQVGTIASDHFLVTSTLVVP